MKSHLLELLVVITFLFSPRAFSKSVKVAPMQIKGAEVKVEVSRIQQQVTLVQSLKQGSDLRVGFVVVDRGGSTDVSPKASLYLTTFNETEEFNGGSSHLISHMNELISSKRSKAGVYEAVLRVYQDEFDCSKAWNSNYEGSVKLRIDARKLTAKVRKLKKAESFVYKNYVEPVLMSYECLKSK